jgi:hypothetical protein
MTGGYARGRGLLRHESGGTGDPQAVGAAAERVCDALRRELSELIGTGGVGALCARALTQAQQRAPLLERVEARPDGTLPGLAQALGSGSAPEAEDAGAAVIDHFLALLASLMGEDVGLRPVRRLWPGMDLGADSDKGIE